MLNIDKLSVSTYDGKPLLNEINMQLKKGEATGLTGESGAGKSTLIKAIMGTLDPQCTISGGRLLIHTEKGREPLHLEALHAKQRRALAGTTIGFVPQNPMSAFDARLKISSQLNETFRIKLGLSKQAAGELSEAKLLEVGLSDTSRIMSSYPHNLSGGMLQRIVIAILLGLNPLYVLADEPTAFLDEENRLHVLKLLKERLAFSSLLLISHDIEALQMLCHSVAVLSEGEIVQQGTMSQLLAEPSHSWTKSLAERWNTSYCQTDQLAQSHARGGENWLWMPCE